MKFASRVAAELRSFRRPGLWFGIWCFGWLLCITLSLVHPPDIDLQLPDGDKIGHFLSYGTLSAWSVLLFRRRPVQLLAALMLVALGVAMELAQGELTNYRMMDPRDAIANTIGICFGQLIGVTAATNWLQRLEARLFR